MFTCLDRCSLHALCHHLCACVLHAMFMCFGLDLVYHVMCYCSLFVHFITFSCVLAYWFRPDLNPMVFVIIHTPGPTSKGLDHPIFHVHACLLLCFMFVLASLVLAFAMSSALHKLDLVWLHLTSMQCYAYHVCLCHPLAFYAS